MHEPCRSGIHYPNIQIENQHVKIDHRELITRTNWFYLLQSKPSDGRSRSKGKWCPPWPFLSPSCIKDDKYVPGWWCQLFFHVIIWIAFPVQKLEWLDSWLELPLEGPPRSSQLQAFPKLASPKKIKRQVNIEHLSLPFPLPLGVSKSRVQSTTCKCPLQLQTQWPCTLESSRTAACTQILFGFPAAPHLSRFYLHTIQVKLRALHRTARGYQHQEI